MGILDQFKKNKEEKKDKEKEKKNQGPLPPEGHTLKEVLADKEHSDLFGEFLAQNGLKDLAERIRDKTLTESDIDLLEEQRKIFSGKMTQTEKLKESITEENIVGFARANPDFQKIVNLVGPGRAVKVIQSQLKELSITDEARFKNIVKKIEAHDKHKNGKYKEINDQVEKLLADNKISSKEYLDVFAIEDFNERRKAQEKLARKYGRKWFHGLNKDLFAMLMDSGDSTEEQVKLLSAKEKAIGSALFATISENESVRKSLFAELVGEKAPVESKIGFNEAKKGTLDEKKFDENWEHEKQQSDYDSQPPDVQENIRNVFVDEQKQKYREANKGKGFWASIFEAMFERMINDKKAKLK